MTLSEEQVAVVLSESRKFAVTAAAGSGKTSVLVDRYIRHVVELDHSPEEIVTLTYGRKAAAEMKQRIVNRLRDMGRFDDAQLAETGPIQTIHSFCERVLRENALEACIDPEFDVLIGPGAAALAEKSVTEAILLAKHESEWASAFVQRYSGKYSFGRTDSHGQLRNDVLNVMEKLRSSGQDPESLAQLYASPESTVRFWLERALGAMPLPLPDPSYLFTTAWGKDLAEKMAQSNIPVPNWLKSQKPESDRLAAEDTCGLVWLAVTAWQWLETEMQRNQEFDFSLLESKAVRLLERSAVARDRVAKQTRALLLDEAQDLNPVQYRLVDLLSAPGEMMVGDPRQSIYGFRFADRNLFMARCETVETYALTVNYRSKPGILEFVDTVFRLPWGQDLSRMRGPGVTSEDPFDDGHTPDAQGVEVWPLAAKDTASVALLVQQVIAEGVRPKKVAVLTRGNTMLRLIAERFKALGIPYKSVGTSEKFYTRLEVRDLANALESLADPYEDYSLLALLHSPFVGLSLDATAHLATRQPVFEAVQERGPWSDEDQVKIDAFRVWFDRTRQTVDRVPAWETLAALLRETPYMESMCRTPYANQAVANVRKLLALATVENTLNAREFATRVRDIQFLRHREGEAPVVDENEDSVTLMTIHKSKGLEFDVVVLPETHGKLSRKVKDIEMDATQGVVVTALRTPPSAFYKWQTEIQVAKDREEELRVLYVGMTRARERLCVVVAEEGGDESASRVLASRAGLPDSVLPGIRVRKLSEPP